MASPAPRERRWLAQKIILPHGDPRSQVRQPDRLEKKPTASLG